MKTPTLALALAAAFATHQLLPAAAQEPGDGAAALVALLADEGVLLDLDGGAIGLRAKTLVLDELLEYVLVGPNGATHESLLFTDVTPSVINAGILALGLDQGENATWVPIDPPPTEDEVRAGAPTHAIVPPQGDGLHPYIAWREGDEVYFVRLEDALCDLAAGRSMRRGPWVFLGSRFDRFRPEEDEVFVADVEQNLINLSFFSSGNTLATASLPECEVQTIWRANSWLLPPPGEDVRLVLARAPLATLPAALAADLPEPSRVPRDDRR